MFIDDGNTSRATAIVQRCSSSDDSWRTGHPRPELRTEVLDDDFLKVPVGLVQRPQRQQCLHPFAPCLTYADQNARS